MKQITTPSEYYHELTRIDEPLFSVRAWYKGESEGLKNLIGVGLFNTFFLSIEENVAVYYDRNEAEEFHNRLKEILTEKFFNDICEEFYEIIEQSKECHTDEEAFMILSKSFPILSIFDEISKYPEIASENIIHRLIRVRTSTESFSYDLFKKIILINEPKNYIYYQGKLYIFNK